MFGMMGVFGVWGGGEVSDGMGVFPPDDGKCFGFKMKNFVGWRKCSLVQKN